MVPNPYLFSYTEEAQHIDKIPDGHKLPIKTVFVKKQIIGEKVDDSDPNKNKDKAQETKNKDDEGVYVVKMHIIRLFDENSPAKTYTLIHAFNEPFNIVQIYIKDKENLAYTLSENKDRDQFITVWNFKKELLLCWKQLNKRVNKFVLYPGKADHLLMIGKQYFRSWDINFTKKSFKENSSALIAMRTEKENNFVDIEFIKGTETYFLLSATGNQIFINQELAFKYEDNADESDNHSDSFEESKKPSHSDDDKGSDMYGTGSKGFGGRSKRRSHGHDANIKDKNEANFSKYDFMKGKDMQFQ